MVCCIALGIVAVCVRALWRSITLQGKPTQIPFAPPAFRPAPGQACVSKDSLFPDDFMARRSYAFRMRHLLTGAMMVIICVGIYEWMASRPEALQLSELSSITCGQIDSLDIALFILKEQFPLPGG